MMRFLAIVFFLFTALLGGTEVKIASYNVENLFDLVDDGTEYEEYIPNTSWGWDASMQRIKLRNTAQVLRDMQADIVGLQEIESEQALKDLRAELNRQGLYYPYYAFSRGKNTTVSVALLSRYPIKSVLNHSPGAHRAFRNIMEAKVEIEGRPLRVFVNHWKSKSGPESKRLQSAKLLSQRLAQLDEGEEYVLLGDFNSHYEEHRTFLKSRRHNDTNGITGINHILGTIDEAGNPLPYSALKQCNGCLYNPWYEVPESKRWSHQYKKHYEGLDHILIPPSLADGKGIEYVRGSFRRFDPSYLFMKGKIYRWQQSRSRPKHHTGEGYSDHLPVYASLRI